MPWISRSTTSLPALCPNRRAALQARFLNTHSLLLSADTTPSPWQKLCVPYRVITTFTNRTFFPSLPFPPALSDHRDRGISVSLMEPPKKRSIAVSGSDFEVLPPRLMSRGLRAIILASVFYTATPAYAHECLHYLSWLCHSDLV